jgi:hypothetical protein
VLWPPDPSRARRILVPSLPIHPPPPTSKSIFLENAEKITQPRQMNLYGGFMSDCPNLYIPFFKRWMRLHPDILVPSLPIHPPPPTSSNSIISESVQKITQPRQINLYAIFVAYCPSIYPFHSSKSDCGFILFPTAGCQHSYMLRRYLLGNGERICGQIFDTIFPKGPNKRSRHLVQL